MSTAVNPNDYNSTIEHTAKINELPNTSSLMQELGIYDREYTGNESIIFDKVESAAVLLPDSNRRAGNASYGKDEVVKTYALPLSYHVHKNNVTKGDIQSKRKAGTADGEQDLADVISRKLALGRTNVDQTMDYMMLQGLKGICKTPDGTVLADMFTEFGVTQTVVDFELGTAGTNVEDKCNEVLDAMQNALQNGGTLSGTQDVLVDRSFFSKLKGHPSVQQAYLNSVSNVEYQRQNSQFREWGISNVFEFNGLRFLVAGHTYSLPDGSSEKAVAVDTGHVVPKVSGGESLFRAYHGPSTRLSSVGGQDMFAWEQRSSDDTSHEMTYEMSLLCVATAPKVLVKLITSN